eukprot:CAMPEP_0201477140 /NCGR_PEP_ID=MMETSP0151_2-20130828/2229_1 /ASSEMBLY_ACC=CAM_ASM_000257 /TAXON_ID=200890 /ORGANISM="Paramoeba atlantica, Strain 621/1 / CCAP 1560/9" /LENGTH=275 /DNA_ID=CAMNT_0047857763 /DNA_START=184 /DNA_END=1011 /DNA_ORIENTATION=+
MCFPGYAGFGQSITPGMSYLVDVYSVFEAWHSMYFELFSRDSNPPSEYPSNISMYYFDKCPGLTEKRENYLEGTTPGGTQLYLNPGSTVKMSWAFEPDDLNATIQVIRFESPLGIGDCNARHCVLGFSGSCITAHYYPLTPYMNNMTDYVFSNITKAGTYLIEWFIPENATDWSFWYTLDVSMTVYPTSGASSSCSLSSGGHCPYKKNKCMIMDFDNVVDTDALTYAFELDIPADPYVTKYVLLIQVLPISALVVVIGALVWKCMEREEAYQTIN